MFCVTLFRLTVVRFSLTEKSKKAESQDGEAVTKRKSQLQRLEEHAAVLLTGGNFVLPVLTSG